MTKRCTSCRDEQPLENFYLLRGRPKSKCKRCCIAETVERNKGSKARQEYMRDYHLRRTYGLSADEYDQLAAEQSGLCAICKNPPPGRRALSVDHDHATGQVRGLLCNSCNSAMGRIGDDPDRLLAMAMYLLNWSSDGGLMYVYPGERP